MDPNDFWKNELLRANDDVLFSCWIYDPNPYERVNGLVISEDQQPFTGTQNLPRRYPDHAYAITKAAEYNGKKFLKIRNPWGNTEWSGPWADGSKEWTQEWLPALKVMDYSFGNDGEFIMEYGDFLEHWESIERTQLFDQSWVQSSHWLNVTGRPLPSAYQYGDVSCKSLLCFHILY